MSSSTFSYKGRTYSAGNTFTAAAAGTWYGSADGGNGSGTIAKGATVKFRYNYTNQADWYYYPILVQGSSFNGGYDCWVSNTSAIFPPATYTISYNANGGSGAPGAQTKTWNVNLTLSSTQPTRTGYDFLGWSTSSSATSATWSAGGTYTTNSGNTLYAVWKASTSTITSKTNVTLSTSSTVNSIIKWKPNDSSFKFKITASVPAAVGTAYSITTDYIIPNKTTEHTYNLGFDSTWINKITKTTTATCTLTLTTYNSSGTSLGTNSTTITLTTPSGLIPSISIGTITVNGTAAFANKITTLDKINIPWTFTPSYSSALKSLSIDVNGEHLTATSGSSGTLVTTNMLQNYGTNTLTASVLDQRNNEAQSTKDLTGVYRYFYPEVHIKYLSTKKLEITGNIAYVGGANNKQVLLSIYENNNITPIVNNSDITSAGTWTATGTTDYDKYYPINFGNGYDISSLVSNIDTSTYRFVITVIDSKGQSSASVNSAVPVITFSKGGTGITAHKPTTFESGIQPMDSNDITGLEILPTRLSDELGGRIKLDRGVSTARDAYIDTYDNKLRFIDRNPSTAIRASLNLTNGNFDSQSLSVNNISIGQCFWVSGNFVSGGWNTKSYTAKLVFPATGMYLVWMYFNITPENATMKAMYKQLSMYTDNSGAEAMVGATLYYDGDGNSSYAPQFIRRTISQPILVTSVGAYVRPYVHCPTNGATFNVGICAMYMGNASWTDLNT